MGGVNDPLNTPLCNATDLALFGGFQNYDDETLWNYELGVKTQGDGFTFNAGGFYNDISNLQVTLDAGSCSSRIVFNVDKAHTQGFEFELGLQPTDGLDLSLSGSIIEAEFDTTLPGALAGATGIREGNRLPSVPKFQLSASGSYEWPVGDGRRRLHRGIIPACRHALHPARRPGEQPAHLYPRPALRRRSRRIGDDGRSDVAQLPTRQSQRRGGF